MPVTPPPSPPPQRAATGSGENRQAQEAKVTEQGTHQGTPVTLPLTGQMQGLSIPQNGDQEPGPTASIHERKHSTPKPSTVPDTAHVEPIKAEVLSEGINAVFTGDKAKEIPSVMQCIIAWNSMSTTSTYGSILQSISLMDYPCKNPRPDSQPPAMPTVQEITNDMVQYCKQFPGMTDVISFTEDLIKVGVLSVTDRPERHRGETGLDYVHLNHVKLVPEELEKLQTMMQAPPENGQKQSAWDQDPETYSAQQRAAGYSGTIQASNFFGKGDDISEGYWLDSQFVTTKEAVNEFIHNKIEIPMRQAKLDLQKRADFVKFIDAHFKEETTDTKKIIDLVAKYFTR